MKHTALLSRGYPTSVLRDYARGHLTTQALLTATSLSDGGATALSATTLFVARNRMGLAGGLVFASPYSAIFRARAKQWRLLATSPTPSSSTLSFAHRCSVRAFESLRLLCKCSTN